jgi:N6-adenosine-specific RNA methylase IME4
MTVEEISALPVSELADESGCHLYLWTTNRYLPAAFDVVSSWGFRYAQLLTWAKTPMGIGPGGAFAQNAEYVLFCRKGTLKHQRRLDSVWFNWHRTAKHSAKPEAFIDMVEQVSPGPYVELFARRHRLGWDVWGNESGGNKKEIFAFAKHQLDSGRPVIHDMWTVKELLGMSRQGPTRDRTKASRGHDDHAVAFVYGLWLCRGHKARADERGRRLTEITKGSRELVMGEDGLFRRSSARRPNNGLYRVYGDSVS